MAKNKKQSQIEKEEKAAWREYQAWRARENKKAFDAADHAEYEYFKNLEFAG